MDDLISRQAAMERLMAQNVIMDGSEYHNGFNAGVNRAQEVIRNLPPVQPNHNAEVSKMEIIHCKDCLYKKICSWKNQGAKFCSFGERGDSE